MIEAFPNLMARALPAPYPIPLTPEAEDNLTPNQLRALAEAERLSEQATMTLRCEGERNAFVIGEARNGVIQVAAAFWVQLNPDDDDPDPAIGIQLQGFRFSVHDWDAERFQRELDLLSHFAEEGRT